MPIPSGRVYPGMAFYRALQGLQRPQAGAEAAESRRPLAEEAVAPPRLTDRSDPARAARPAEPAGSETRTREVRRDLPRGSLLDLKV